MAGYNQFSKGFHWVSALIVLGLIPLGFYMTALDFSAFKLQLYGLHKSFGLTLLALIIARIIWRSFTSVPAPLENHARWERLLAKSVHILLYIGLIGMPLSGWVMTSAGDFPNKFFGLFNVPDLMGKNETVFKISRAIHEYTAFCLMAAIVLHITGGLKHHVIDRDATLRRMLPAKMKKPVLWLFLGLFVISMGASGYMILQHELAEEAQSQISAENVKKQADNAADSGTRPDGSVGWAIIRDESRIGFAATVQEKPFEGQFTEFSGDIYFAPEALDESYADVSVDIKSIKTGSPERDQYIKMQAWLDASEHPQARFRTERFEKTGEDRYVAYGNLTLRGATKPVVVPFTLNIREENEQLMAYMQSRFDINRMDYDIGTGQWSDEKMVAHIITIDVAIKAEQVPGK